MPRITNPTSGTNIAEIPEQTGQIGQSEIVSPNGEGALVAIDPNAPWARWPQPEAVQSKVGDIKFAVDRVYMPAGGERLVITDKEDQIVGYPTSAGLTDLANKVGFPTDFVLKLPLDLQVSVINNRIQQSRDTTFTMTRQPMMQAAPGGGFEPRPEGYRIVTSVAPGWRGILPHGFVAQYSMDVMESVYDPGGVSIQKAYMDDEGMELRLQTNYTAEVRPGGRSVGDVLSLGIQIQHVYGVSLKTALYIERLVCLNGMTAVQSKFEWASRALGDPSSQLNWLNVGIAAALTAFDDFVDKSRKMAASALTGDMEKLLRERARAMRIPQRFDQGLMDAWRLEPDPTEWGMLNAFTRFATHGDGLTDRERRGLQATAGSWNETYDIVSARLPRYVAMSVGATIFDEAEAA